MLELRGLQVFRGPTAVLHDVSLSVREGEVVALIGANGAGKTTTLQTISGLLAPRGGEIVFTAGADAQSLLGRPAEQLVRLGIAHCPEGRQVFASLTVDENLRMGAYSRSDTDAIQEDLDRLRSLFPVLGERRGQRAGSLSGGEQMMLSIARALMARPRLLLLDEPSLGLAPQMVDRVFDTLAELNRGGTTLLLVEQNAAMALEIADRGYLLENGRIALSGSGAELLRDDRVRQAYLGGLA